MIIKRLAEGIKKQDWFVVTIEIMVVVVGIFIGLQVDDWNEERKAAAFEHEATRKLKRDFEELIESSLRRVDHHEEYVLNLRYLVHCLEHECEGVSDDQRIKDALAYGDTYDAVAGSSNTYMELVAAGKLRMFDNEELRLALANYENRQEAARGTFNIIYQMIAVHQRAFKRHSRYEPLDDLTGMEGTNNVGGVGSYDFKAMMGDPEFILAAEQVLRMQSYFLLNHRDLLSALGKVRTTMEKESAP